MHYDHSLTRHLILLYCGAIYHVETHKINIYMYVP